MTPCERLHRAVKSLLIGIDKQLVELHGISPEDKERLSDTIQELRYAVKALEERTPTEPGGVAR